MTDGSNMRCNKVARWGVCCLAMLISLGAGGQEDRARELFRRGKEFYAQAQYEEAIGAFKAAGLIRPSPMLDYNIARCHEKLGQVKEAIGAYQRYLKAKPYASNRDSVQQRIGELKQKLTAAPPAPADESGDHAPDAEEPASAPVAAPVAAPPPPVTAPLQAEEPGAPLHEAMRSSPAEDRPAQTRQQTRPAQAPRRQNPYQAPGKPDEGPFYKQWWFWVGCAAGVAIVSFVIATAVARDDGGATKPSTGGLTISF